jgi:hopene-associated glycosyltransferase HpnB
MPLTLLATLPVFIWVYLLCARGGFWRVPRENDIEAGALRADPGAGRRVVAVIPARDEAPVIGDAVRSLLRQDFAGSLHVIVVDDGSSDGTARAATVAAAGLGQATNLTVVAASALPAGWSGKVWAMSRGAALAATLEPDYLLFTDADIRHEPDNVATLVARAELERRDLVSYMVTLSTATRAERCLIPAFVFFFFKLYPPRWIAAVQSRVAGAAGGCMLVRPTALARAGGLAAIRAEIIDDCALARAMKRSGATLWLGVTRTASSSRRYGSFAEIGQMISRTAFNQLGHSWLLLCATLLGLFLTYLLPPLLLLSGQPLASGLGLAAWLLMSVAYAPTIRFYRVSPLWCAALPAIAGFYAVATLHSALRYARGSGGEWKGRMQDRRASD